MEASLSDDSPLLIVQVDRPTVENTGDIYYRTHAPGIGMAHCDGIYTLSFTAVHRLQYELMGMADVLILNNICDADILPVIRDRKTTGKLTIYELSDDLWEIPTSNPVQGYYSNSKNLLLTKRLANYCDALQFSSHELHRKFGYLNGVCAVFPNHMLEIPPERKKKPSGMVTVGWGGSSGHLQDMERISVPLIEWIMSRENVRLHLMCHDLIWAIFDKLPRDRIIRSATGSLQDYYSFVSQLDIGLAPLEDIAFNRSRSDIKFLEYAAHSVVPVVQAMDPYLMSVQHGKTGFLFRSTDELISIVDKLASDVSTRTEVAAAAYKYVLRERNQIEHGRDRVDFYRRLPAAAGWNLEPKGSKAEEIFKRLCNCAGVKKTGRNLSLKETRYESLLRCGLSALQFDKSSASAMFQEAIQINPENYMPYLCGAFVYDDTVGFLKNAVQKNPRSIVAWIFLGTVYGCKQMTLEAIESFKTASRIFPEYERPYIECANYLNKIGRKREGIDLLKLAIGVIPDQIRNAAGSL
jgi:hypothetical protein